MLLEEQILSFMSGPYVGKALASREATESLKIVTFDQSDDGGGEGGVGHSSVPIHLNTLNIVTQLQATLVIILKI